MATVRLSDVVLPESFTSYVVENTAERSELVTSGVMSRNAEIEAQLRAGADRFTVPVWLDLGNDEANIVNDDPDDEAIPRKLGSASYKVRKSYLHQSWSAMNLASELAGSDALQRIQSRATAYWTRQLQRRLIASLNGVLADNIANDGGDMLFTASGAFGATAVIDAAATLGDAMRDLRAIAMHSDTYALALKNDLIATVPDSRGGFIQTFRGMAVIVDDLSPVDRTDPDAPIYTSVLFGPGAVAYGMTEPRIAEGTEIENRPAAGNGGGQQVLHTRANIAIHPAGFSFTDASVALESPSMAELALASNWERVAERKNVPLAFLRHG